VIFVDQPIWPAHGRRFAHLISDASLEELHAFAAALGLPERAFHRDHYDIPDVWVADAVAAGATEVDPRELVRRLRDSGLRRPKVRSSTGAGRTGPPN
jgi:hypothetical protein